MSGKDLQEKEIAGAESTIVPICGLSAAVWTIFLIAGLTVDAPETARVQSAHVSHGLFISFPEVAAGMTCFMF